MRRTLLHSLCVLGPVLASASSLAAEPGSANSEPALLNRWLRSQSPSFTNWDIGGNVRAQVDVKDNAGSFPDAAPDRDFIRRGHDNDDSVFLLREKVHVGYRSDWIQVFVEGRDSSTTGDDRNPNPFADEMDLHQAFVRIGNSAAFPLSLKIGRQQMSYGDERFVEVADWSNLERTFDAARLRLEYPGFWIDGFVSHYVIPDDRQFNQPNWHDLFCGVYASSRSLVPRLETELYLFSHNVDPGSPRVVNSTGSGPAPRDVYSIGARVKSLPGQLRGFDYGAEVMGQLGSVNQGGRRLAHEAYAAAATGGFTFTNAFSRPRLGLDIAYGSGDSNPNDDRHETFDLLFGAAHKYYGIMDVTGLRNTFNPSVSLTATPARNLSVRLEYLLFWLADTHDLSYAEVGKGRTANGYGIHAAFSSFVGSEIDLIVNYATASWLNLQAGYSHFFVSDYIRQSVEISPSNGGAADANYFYLQARFNF